MQRSIVRGAAVAVVLALAGCGSAPQGGGVVAAASPEAAEAGALILQAGGNAVDAAVAVSFALGVTEPAMSGLGGQTQLLLHAPGGRPVVINGTSYAPGATPVDADSAAIETYRATTVPTTVRVLEYAWRHYGSGRIPWAQLLEPAIRYAEDGFVVGPFRHRVWVNAEEALRATPAARSLFLTEAGTAPAEGSVFRQPELAQTLRRLAEQGADDFYHGEIARAVARDMASNGGWLSLEDLERLPQPVELDPLRGSYRGWDVYSLPPPGGGWVVLQILNLLEHAPPEALAPGSPARMSLLAQALRLGHLSRRDTPVHDLVNYEADVDAKIDKAHARELLEIGPGETTHFSVADGDGMAVAVTASINYAFGAKAADSTLGFLYNDYMREFVLGDPQHPFALRPNAMPYSSMSPTIVARDGEPVLALGSPGSARIISAVAQVAQLWVDEGLDVGSAVAAYRLHVIPDSALFVEWRGAPDSALEQLVQRGFVLVEPSSTWDSAGRNAYFGGVHAVARRGGEWRGAADPRRDGAVR
ncbi:MAG: gamma-glutamyltransferase family protein [Gemmatimonadota bacterium]|nr:MAG: gamma-glutamyltransferase family protein [Gemmatimonadota bacterium]